LTDSIKKSLLFERVSDVEFGGGVAGVLDWRRVVANFSESIDHGLGVAGELDAAGVGQIFAAAREGKLEEIEQDGSDDGEEISDKDKGSGLAISITIAGAVKATAQGNVDSHDEGASEDGDERGEEDIVVTDVGEFVGDDGFEFVAVELVQETSGNANDGVLGVPAGGESVGGGIVHDVEGGEGEVSAEAEIFGDGVEVVVLFFGGGVGVGISEDDAVGKVIGDKTPDGGDKKGDAHD
jgi:hypothetical protein